MAPSKVRFVWPGRDARHVRLAAKAARGDRDAFCRLYQELYGLVLTFVRARVHEPADAEDLTALVFHKMLEKLGTHDPSRGSVRTWVLAMARHAVIDHHRTRRNPIPAESIEEVLADAALSPLESIERDEQARIVRTLLGRQSAEVREMLALRFSDGLRHREISELLGLSEAAVKQRFSRTLRELRAAAREAMREKERVNYAV